MEMQNVIAQLSVSETLSESISKNLVTTSEQLSVKNEKFEKVMSDRMQENGQQNKKELSNASSTRTFSDKRQTEMLRSSKNADITEECEEVENNQSLQNEQISLEKVNALSNQNIEAALEWNADVEEKVCEELDITLEELECIMSQLGLQLADLQDLSNLQQLVLFASGESDNMLLLTDENLGEKLQNLIKDISQITQTIQEQFGISKEEFSKLMENSGVAQDNDTVKTSSDAIDVSDLNNVNDRYDVDDVNSVQPQKSLDFEDVNAQLQMTNEKSQIKENVTMHQNTKENVSAEKEVLQVTEDNLKEEQIVSDTNVKDISQEIVVTDKNLIKEENVSITDEDIVAFDGEEIKTDKMTTTTGEVSVEVSAEEVEFPHSDGKKDSQLNGGKEQSLFEQFISNLTAEKVNITEDVSVKATVVEQMREIVNQVVEQIKITVKPDTSAMEIQLNPENLGKVNLSVVAKEGHITAQFVTETEMAKHALEGQIQQLRETLGEQGLKVDEVEVTVSNFDFNQSSQANAEEQKQQQQSIFSKKAVRSLNIHDMEDLEDLTEEEQLAAKIMQLNGNQVDYTA